MSSFWTSLTDGQGEVLAALVTVLGALVGVVIGWFLFSGKVRNLESALEESIRSIEEHRRSASEKMEVMNEQISALLDGIGQIRGGVSDIQTVSTTANDTQSQADLRDDIKQNWIAIRDKLESYASSHPDGRTRARYARMDRRNYDDLIRALGQDGVLGDRTHQFREASELWQRFQRGRAIPTDGDRARMIALRENLGA